MDVAETCVIARHDDGLQIAQCYKTILLLKDEQDIVLR